MDFFDFICCSFQKDCWKKTCSWCLILHQPCHLLKKTLYIKLNNNIKHIGLNRIYMEEEGFYIFVTRMIKPLHF